MKEYTDAQLREELFRRDRKSEISKIPTNKIDWSGVESSAESIVKRIQDGDYHEDNCDHVYMLEEVMTAVYGRDYYKWQNKYTN